MRWYHRRVDTRTGERYYEHRAIAEWKIGRPLRPGEIVHHLNNDPRDNHPDNLAVLPSQSAHMRLHHYQRREAAGVQHLFPVEVFLQEQNSFQVNRVSLDVSTRLVKGSISRLSFPSGKHSPSAQQARSKAIQKNPWPWSRETYYTWAYHHGNDEYTLGPTYDESIKEIALSYADYPEDDFFGPFTWALRQPRRWNEDELQHHLITITQTPDDQRDYTMPRIDNSHFDPERIAQAVMRYYEVLDAAGMQLP